MLPYINTCKKSALAFTLIQNDLAIFWREKIFVRRDFNNCHCSRKIGEVAEIEQIREVITTVVVNLIASTACYMALKRALTARHL